MKKVLLASHGSKGAIAAEQAAIACCHAGDELHHLYVIPSWWADMTGDDWLNNGASRNRYRRYLENELYRESEVVVERIQAQCEQKKIKYASVIEVGNSEDCLAVTARKEKYKKVIVGNHRPKNITGLRDQMLSARIQEHFGSQLAIISYPHATSDDFKNQSYRQCY